MRPSHDTMPNWARKNKLFSYTYKLFRMLRDEGIAQTAYAAKQVLLRRDATRLMSQRYKQKPKERAAQQRESAGWNTLISIAVPLYNTPESYLRELLDSVLRQSYEKWQLCLADGSDADNALVESICREYAEKDSRIIYARLSENRGISGNTNAAIELAAGDYIALVDHDDLLAPDAMFEAAKAIETERADFLYSNEGVFSTTPLETDVFHMKPVHSPDYLRCCNYVTHLSIIKRELLEKVGPYDSRFDGSQDYDFTLRATERAEKIYHITKPLYFWRVHEGSVADDISAKPYAYTAAKRAIEAHLERVGLKGTVEYSRAVPMFHVNYDIIGEPLISILIPNRDQLEDLKKCIDSIEQKSTYKNYEIIVIENNSETPEIFEYYKQLEARANMRVVTWPGEFNFSAINNFGARYANGEQLLFLNNDIEVITPEWLEQMLMFTQREDVAACGAKLLYPDDTVQHGGIIVGVGRSAANLYNGSPRGYDGYMSRLAVVSNLSACTAACLMVKAEAFKEVGGFEESLAVAFNDVDLCLKLRAAGYYIVFNPVAECYHYESRSRGYDVRGKKRKRKDKEAEILRARWPQYYKGLDDDPFCSRYST